MMLRRRYSLILALLLFVLPLIAYAQSAAELQKQIDDNNAQIAALDREIAQYQAQLDATTEQKNTLQNKINQLDLQRKQLNAKISVTKSQISTTQAQITQLSRGIASAEDTIAHERRGLAETIRFLDRQESAPLSLIILSSDTISDAWRNLDEVVSLQQAMRDDMRRLASEKRVLTDTKTVAEEKRAQLVKQQTTLTTQQGSLDATRKAQNELLAQTKSQEGAYQSILSQKQSEKEAFEKEIFDLGSQLQYILDPSKIPTAGSSVFAWPLDTIRVTQLFGRTSSARRLYSSGTHDGVDFSTRTPGNPSGIGTPVKSTLTGIVTEVNEGAVPYCQYGKWVLVRHPNGLTTLYAHLSQISVARGQNVSTGQVVGYSGDTGYATGPHLHFTVYASEAVTLKTYRCKSGRSTNIPIANPSAYLDPMDYLPAL